MFATGLIALIAAAPSAAAQGSALGRVDGTVFDSLRMRPLAGAIVWIAGVARVAVSDTKGAFVLDSVPEGQRTISFSSSALDSAGLNDFGATVAVSSGKASTVKLATTSLRTLWRTYCADQQAGVRDSGIVYGHVRDLDDNARLVKAPVSFSWMNVDPRKQQFDFATSSKVARSDSTGAFYACGLPIDVELAIRAYGNGAASGEIGYTINGARLARLDLSVTKDLASIHNRRGRATLRGIVLSTEGTPVAEAIVSMSGADSVVRTDGAGMFLLQNVPAGTQSLQVRKIGMMTTNQIVDLAPDRVTETQLRMQSGTVLGALNVRAHVPMSVFHEEFLERRKIGLGKAIDFEKRNYVDLFSPLLSEGRIIVKFDTVSRTRVARMRMGKFECTPRLYLDGALVPDETILDMRAQDIKVVEVFASFANLPPRFMGSALGGAMTGSVGMRKPPSLPCGAIAWWTKTAW